MFCPEEIVVLSSTLGQLKRLLDPIGYLALYSVSSIYLKELDGTWSKQPKDLTGKPELRTKALF